MSDADFSNDIVPYLQYMVRKKNAGVFGKRMVSQQNTHDRAFQVNLPIHILCIHLKYTDSTEFWYVALGMWHLYELI